MILYLYFSIMLLVSCTWAVFFIYKPMRNSDINIEKSNIELGRIKSGELKQDLDDGLISGDSYESALSDITQTLAEELRQPQHKFVTTQGASVFSFIFIVLALPIMSVSVYESLTTNPKHIFSDNSENVISDKQIVLSLEENIEIINSKLIDTPNDFKLLEILGLIYLELGQLNESILSYKRAFELKPNDLHILTGYAFALASSQNNNFSGLPIDLIQKALKINPNSSEALYLFGMHALNLQKFKLAKTVWETATPELINSPAASLVLKSSIAELSTLINNVYPSGIKVSVDIDISKDILDKRSGDSFIMVYAKSPIGRPMPIAIQKITLSSFTGNITLSDLDSVMPTRRLSDVAEVIIVARLSDSGSAMKKKGDIDISSLPLSPSIESTVSLIFK